MKKTLNQNIAGTRAMQSEHQLEGAVKEGWIGSRSREVRVDVAAHPKPFTLNLEGFLARSTRLPLKAHLQHRLLSDRP